MSDVVVTIPKTVTIPETIQGFQGFRYRWWERGHETPFPDWMSFGVTA